jgi:uncharacterized membrane protein
MDQINGIIIFFSYLFVILGSIIIIYGGLRAAITFFYRESTRTAEKYYKLIRIDFTSRIVLGLELFIAADLLSTILEPTFNEIIILGITVTIRTIIGYFLDKETKEM